MLVLVDLFVSYFSTNIHSVVFLPSPSHIYYLIDTHIRWMRNIGFICTVYYTPHTSLDTYKVRISEFMCDCLNKRFVFLICYRVWAQHIYKYILHSLSSIPCAALFRICSISHSNGRYSSAYHFTDTAITITNGVLNMVIGYWFVGIACARIYIYSYIQDK